MSGDLPLEMASSGKDSGSGLYQERTIGQHDKASGTTCA